MTDEEWANPTFDLLMEECGILDYAMFSSDLKVLLRIRAYNDGAFLWGRKIEEVIYWGA
jgi:Leu/Phe-tRNA-protein transferase